MIKKSRVRVLAGVAGRFSPPGSAFCGDFYFSIHSTAVERKRSWSFCQKCRWQVTEKNTFTLCMWLCMKWHDMVHGCVVSTECGKMAAVSHGSSHVTTKERCKYITSVDIEKRTIKSRSRTQSQCNKSALSRLNCGEKCYIKAISDKMHALNPSPLPSVGECGWAAHQQGDGEAESPAGGTAAQAWPRPGELWQADRRGAERNRWPCCWVGECAHKKKEALSVEEGIGAVSFCCQGRLPCGVLPIVWVDLIVRVDQVVQQG